MVLKQRFKRTKMSLLLAAFTVTAPFSIFAVSDKNAEFSREYLDKAYSSFIEGKLPMALNELEFSNECNTTKEALVFKVQLEYMIGDKGNATKTLNELKKLYPDDVSGYMLSAIIFSLEKKDGNEILKNIQTALRIAVSNNERENILGMVEEDNSFDFFRTVCKKQYNVLAPEMDILKLDSTYSELDVSGISQSNKAKWEAKGWGPRLWLNNEDCKNLHNGAYVADKILIVVPQPYRAILKITLKISDKRIQHANKGRGVIMNWTWANAATASFWLNTR